MGFFIAGYLLYLEIPRESQELNIQEINTSSGLSENIDITEFNENKSIETPQFYKNMRFNHNNISYNINSECSDEKQEKMILGFQEIQRRVGIIRFYKTSEELADIKVYCSEDSIEKNENVFIVGEGGPSSIINSSLYPVIEGGTILLYKSSKCDEPLTEIHELMHVFGFDHINDTKNILNPYLDCKQELSQEHINKLIELYSVEPLPDLYFENANATISGRYLSFDVSVKNQGLINAKDVFLKIYSEDKFIEEFELGEIKFGAGKRFYVKNLKLPALSINKIKLKIISENNELIENNNIINLESKN